MTRQIKIKASDKNQPIEQLLNHIQDLDEHVIVERDGYPIAVILSYKQYEQLGQPVSKLIPLASLPPTMTLEEAFGSVTPISQPEDFSTLRDTAIEEHVKNVQEKMEKD